MTGPVDAVRLYYRPVVGPMLRRRAVWIESVLKGRPPDNVLEVGYGSGILQPTLASLSKRLYGVDIHALADEVAARLAEVGVPTHLLRASGEQLPFADAMFGAVVMVSTLSFIRNPATALREARRVLRPGGRLVALVPRVVPMADQAWELLTRRSPSQEFDDRRQLVRHAINRELPVTRRQRRPRLVPPSLAPYELIVADKPMRAH